MTSAQRRVVRARRPARATTVDAAAGEDARRVASEHGDRRQRRAGSARTPLQATQRPVRRGGSVTAMARRRRSRRWASCREGAILRRDPRPARRSVGARRTGRRRGGDRRRRTAASSPPPTPSCTAPTSGSRGRADSTSAGRRPPSTSPTSPRWARGRRRCSSRWRCPNETRLSFVERLADGLRAACDALAPGCAVEGGDLTVSDTLTIAVTALGVARRPRAGAPLRRAAGRRRRGRRRARRAPRAASASCSDDSPDAAGAPIAVDRASSLGPTTAVARGRQLRPRRRSRLGAVVAAMPAPRR